MNRNPETCPHNITDTDDDEFYCTECGEVLGSTEDSISEDYL